MHCRKCGYDLQGVDSECCPECGTPYDQFFSESYVSKPVSGRRVLWRSLAVFGCAVYIVAAQELIAIDMPTWLKVIVALLGMACMIVGASLAIEVLTHGGRALRGRLPWHVHRGCTLAATAIAAGSVLLVVGYLWRFR